MLNEFTLFEVMARFCLAGGFGKSLDFPNLGAMRIVRPLKGKLGEKQEIPVFVLTQANTFDCSRNIQLQFGDVIDIPQREHGLTERAADLSSQQKDSLQKCLERKATFIVKGQLLEVSLSGYHATYLSEAMRLPAVQSVLRSSSDLSRVKVRRPGSGTEGQKEILKNVEELWRTSQQPIPVRPGWSSPVYTGLSNDLWLRNGDIIEVMDKP